MTFLLDPFLAGKAWLASSTLAGAKWPSFENSPVKLMSKLINWTFIDCWETDESSSWLMNNQLHLKWKYLGSKQERDKEPEAKNRTDKGHLGKGDVLGMA